ncbi:D-alanyl-D-alanine carboxypeptidase [Streptomyces caniscabiei]|uniref:D-alanyl-D-alanine carboxypeptidase n=1 Tax=Streptomyces caniscabiei TaxID=2746961 RepID=UPI0029B20B47|nr:D-alanyl-D-alanine carboxypeptidase [Streptomyces caniscabiei]MDX2602827.1 D-alanyl-D-alanine carboxypeptidase [Streptomyces caniscabiei]MDX2737886.1 D-alanyl-D-alanine carboxypeptidase [Streptomyces caniscabiei]
MAGTSPDRSKRYESSTESTPGNEPAVPDPGGSVPGQSAGSAAPSPDPRLAMSRPSTPKPDQATAVFSRRALLEEAEGGRRGAAESTATEPEAGDGPEHDDAAAAARQPEATAPEAGEAKTADPADEETPSADEATDPTTDEPQNADATREQDDGARETDDGARETDDVRETGGEEPGAGNGADEPGDGVREAAGAAGDSGDGVREAADDAGDSGGGAGEADGDASETGDGGESGDPRERAGDRENGRATGTPAADHEPAATDGAPAATHEPAGDRESGGDTRVLTVTPRKPATDRESTADRGSATDRQPATDGGPVTDREAAADSGPADDHEPADTHEPTADREPATAHEPTGGRASAQDGSAVARDGRAGADDGPAGALDGRRPVAPDEPAVAGGEGAPQGPPADDDESRAGGAGGKVGVDGGAGAAVDQPTAIFRAPRPPAVDQPTTMLKLGDAVPRDAAPAKAAPAPQDAGPRKPDAPEDAGPAETDGRPVHDAVPTGADPEEETLREEGAHGGVGVDESVPPAERTSKFVALKPLDQTTTPRPAAERPAPSLTPAEATRALPQVGPERTTQQPLPPKPPLDLLAELTNTPPPRQTPVRTVLRKVKIWTPLVILLVIVFAVVQAVRPLPTPTLALTTDATYAFEGDKVSLPWPDEGQGWMDLNGIGTMDSFGEQKPVAIGSVAKAMTAYVILKEHPMKPGEKGETIPVDAKAETEGGYDKDGESTLNTVKEGDKLSQYDAIAAIMIPSANNIARLLARWDGNGSEAAFVKKMNAAAKDLGMKNTTYTDPSGLKETTVSTAEDQVKLGNELVKMKALTDITRLPVWYDPSGAKWDNFNRLVPYNNAIGIKTGSTTAAGGNLLFAGTKEVGGETAIVVGAILGQHTPPIIDTVNAVSKTAMIAAQDAVTSDTILKKGDVVGYVDDGLGGRTPVVATKNVTAVGWAGKTVKLELDASAAIPHEGKAGTEVGKLIVGDGAGEGVEVPVALQKPLTEPDFLTRLTRVS